jgi:hypothetical protein
MKVVKAAAVQLSPVLYSREGTIEKIVGKILELGQQGVKFVTFPETVVPYYPYFSFIQAAYQILSGREWSGGPSGPPSFPPKSILSPRTNTKTRYATPRHLQIGLDQPRKPFPRTRLNLLCFDGRLVTTAASSGRRPRVKRRNIQQQNTKR